MRVNIEFLWYDLTLSITVPSSEVASMIERSCGI